MPPDDRPFSEHQKPFSAGAGCLIPIVIVTIVVALVAWAIYSFFAQDRALDRFTAPGPLPIVPAAAPVEDLEVLHRKLAAAADRSRDTLVLDIDDLNRLLATDPRLDNVAPVFKLNAISAEAITATASLKVRALPGRPARYVNGTLTFVPRVLAGDLTFDLQSLTVPGKAVPEDFVAGYRRLGLLDSMLLEPFDDVPAARAALDRIGEVALGDGHVTVRFGAAAD